MAGGEAVTYLRVDRVRSPVHICCREAEQAIAGRDKAILAAVVINQPVTVAATVVFDRQLLTRIQEVRTAKETSLIVMDGNLNLRARQLGKYEDHPQPSLHSGLGLRLGQPDHTA